MTAPSRASRRSILTICAALAMGAFVAGCSGDDEEGAPARSVTPSTFAITATAEGTTKKALEFPATIEAGLVNMRLTNTDKVPRAAQIVRVLGDHTVDEVLTIVNGDAAKVPSWMQDGGGTPAVKPGATTEPMQILAPGKYVIWDDEGGDEDDAPGNDELGARGEFTVTGRAATDAELPERPATVTATDHESGGERDYSFEFDGLKAGSNDLRFENTGEELHHALFLPLARTSRSTSRRAGTPSSAS